MKFYLTLAVCLGLLLIFLGTKAGKMRFHEDPDLMEQEILHYIPIGNPIADAKTIMKQNGFKCEYREKGTFVEERYDENAPGRVRQTIYEDVDFLYCDISKGFFIVARRWQAALIHRERLVTKISVSTGLIGP